MCRRGVVQCWVLQSSITCFAYCISFICHVQTSFAGTSHCIIVFLTFSLSSLRFFIFHKFIQVVFPSLGWSSGFSLSSCRNDKSWGPLGSSSGQSFWALRGNSQGLAPFQFLLCLDPTCLLHVSICSSASLALLCCTLSIF